MPQRESEQRRGAEVSTIPVVALSNLIGHIERSSGPGGACRLAVVLPLKENAQGEIRALLDAGPPFDPETIQGLDRHEVFLTPEEVVFFFESGLGTQALAAAISRSEVWQSASAWQEHLDGPPRIAEEVFSWSRVEGKGEGDVYYLPTPGPGDSDGGDVY